MTGCCVRTQNLSINIPAQSAGLTDKADETTDKKIITLLTFYRNEQTIIFNRDFCRAYDHTGLQNKL